MGVCVYLGVCVDGGAVILKNITSYMGECRCGVCVRVFFPVHVSMAEPLRLRASVAAVCARACVFLPARVSMAVFKNITSYLSECVAAFVLTCGV